MSIFGDWEVEYNSYVTLVEKYLNQNWVYTDTLAEEFHVSSFCSFLGPCITGRKTTNKNFNQKAPLKKKYVPELEVGISHCVLKYWLLCGPSDLCS